MHPKANLILQATKEFTELYERGPTVPELVEATGIHRNTIYGWMGRVFIPQSIMAWEPDTKPRRLMLIKGMHIPAVNVRNPGCPAAYQITAKDWRETLAFFQYRCAWCGAWSNKLHKDEVPRVFPWTDFGRNEDWTGIVVPACETHHGRMVFNIDPDCLERVREWVETNRNRYVYQ